MAGRETGFDQSNADWKAPENQSKRPIKVIKKAEAEKKSLDLKMEDIQEVSEPGSETHDQFLGQVPSGVESLRLDVKQKKEYKGSMAERKDTYAEIDKLFGKIDKEE